MVFSSSFLKRFNAPSQGSPSSSIGIVMSFRDFVYR